MNTLVSPENYSNFYQIIWGSDGVPTSHIYVLLDCACDERIYPEMIDCGLEYQCLYPGILSEELATVAPYLVKLKQQSEFTKWIYTEGWGGNWGVYLTVDYNISFDTLHHFQQMVRVRDERDKILFFRFYDPRVLRVYLPTCRNRELRSIFGSVKNFCMEDETGMNVLDFRFDGIMLQQRKVEIATLASEAIQNVFPVPV